jgi:hypothetical protein
MGMSIRWRSVRAVVALATALGASACASKGPTDDASGFDESSDSGSSEASDDSSFVLGEDGSSHGSDAEAGERDAGGDDGATLASCDGGLLACGGSCVDPTTPAHCGTCGNACTTAVANAQPTCTAGTCSFSCSAGYNLCGGTCVLYTTSTNCGGCGAACSGGTPVCAGSGGTYSCVSGCPSAAPVSCSGSCVDPTSDTRNCATCGHACTTALANAAAACVSSACTVACNSGYSNCSGACVDEQTDNGNCGGCGAVCAAGLTCKGGECACSLPADIDGGPLVYYAFEGNAKDGSGNGNNGIATSGTDVTYGPGKLGQGVTILSGGEGVAVTGSTSLSGPKTLCAWINPQTGTTGQAMPLFVAGAGGAVDYYDVEPAGSASAGGCTVVADGLFMDNGACSSTALTVTPGAWSFVCFSYSGSSTTFFANANMQNVSGGQYDPYLLSQITIGSNLMGGSTTQGLFKGQVDEVSIWSGSLSATDVAALYNQGNGCRIP